MAFTSKSSDSAHSGDCKPGKMNQLLCPTLTVLLLLAMPSARPADGDSVRAGKRVDPPNDGLRLNEILASNRAGRLDDEGESSDWVEIHNSGTRPERLGSYHLTDDPALPQKWKFPNNMVPAPMHGSQRVSGSASQQISESASQ